MVFQDLRRLYALLRPTDRRRIWAIGALIAVAALLQLASLSAMYAFLASVVSEDGYLPWPVARLGEALGIEGARRQQVLLAGIAFGLLVSSNLALATIERAKFRLEARTNAWLSTRLFASYLQQDYPFFVENNSAGLSKNVLTSVREVTANLLRPALDLASKVTMSVTIVALLVVLDPVVSVAVALLMAVGFFGIYVAMRRWVRRQGEIVDQAQRDRFRVVSEALGGIKEVKVLGREESLVRRFQEPSQRMASAQGAYEFSFHLYKYALETVGFGAILVLVTVLLVQGRPVAEIVPIVGLLGIAGYRLMPALRDMSAAFAAFDFYGPFFAGIRDDFRDAQPRLAAPRLPLESAIELHGVGFSYPASGPVLRDVTLAIPAGSIVGLVGSSGAGKSTLADLLMGLRRPDAGRILIDGVPLTKETWGRWQANIGYVPQEIFLADATIAENIAFGVPVAEIDQEAVRRAARLAQIADLVETRLPQGYATLVGERGVKLSGGQRQRIGIARALYNDPSVLVLDEATSDVDGRTESSIAQAVRELGGRKTIIVIAHRPTAIRSCQTLFFLEHGRLAATGSYDDLARTTPAFRATLEGLHGA